MSGKKTTNKKDPSVEELMASASDNKALMHMITGVSGAGLAAVLVGGVVLATTADNNDSQVASEVRVTHESTENDSDAETSSSGEAQTKTQKNTESDSAGSGETDGTVTHQDEIPGIGGDSTSGHDGTEPSEQGNSTSNGKQTKGTYVIKDGDTLSSISGSLGISIDRLIGYNEIVDPNMIFAGAALELPFR